MILVCSGLALDRFTHDSSLFRFGFRLGSGLYTGLHMILVYSVFGLILGLALDR